MNLKSYLFVAVLFLLASCSSKTTLPYFTDITATEASTLPGMNYIPTIQPSDELFISVSSEQPLATAAYQLPFANPASTDVLIQSSIVRTQTYVVDTEGNIYFPVLGKLHVAGMSVEQLRNELVKRISADVKDPIVNVSMVNFDVFVGGEVKNPTSVRSTNNRLTVLEALAKAGDMTEYGNRDNVLLIREVNGQRQVIRIDLTDSKVLTSPYYYLQPRDYIYVAPNAVRQANSKYNQNNAFKLQVISTITSACSVIASLVIALTR